MKLYGGENKNFWIHTAEENEMGPYPFRSAEILEGTSYSGQILRVETTEKGTLYFVLRNVLCWRIS